MVGLIIAFQDYDPFLGIGAMFSLDNFVGFKHFTNFFDSIFFWNVVRNTVLISFYKLLFGFPLPIILALMINEVRITVFQRTVQTISYLPHFFSMVVAAGIVRAMLTPQGGLLNQAIVAFGGEAQAFLTDPNLFRSIAGHHGHMAAGRLEQYYLLGCHGHHQPGNVRSRRHGRRQPASSACGTSPCPASPSQSSSSSSSVSAVCWTQVFRADSAPLFTLRLLGLRHHRYLRISRRPHRPPILIRGRGRPLQVRLLHLILMYMANKVAQYLGQEGLW